MSEIPKKPQQTLQTGDPTLYPDAHPGAPRDPDVLVDLFDAVVKQIEGADRPVGSEAMSVEKARNIIRAFRSGEKVDQDELSNARRIIGAQTSDE